MDKRHRYTLFCFLFAAFFVLVSMAGMDWILRKKEGLLLRESGTAEVDSPVAAWQEPVNNGTQEEDVPAADQEEERLTIEQMEKVISYRSGATEEILHEPVPGQITMEEAIASGEDWLAEMGFTGDKMESTDEGQGKNEDNSGKEREIAVEGKNSQVLARRASLGVKKDKTAAGIPMEPYYSFWTVRYSNESIYAVLSINAVTGKIWDAKITFNNNMSYNFLWEKLDLFLELAGVQEDTENFVEINDSHTGAVLRLKNSPLYAEIKYYDIAVSYNGENGSLGADEEYRTKVVDADGVIEHSEDKKIQCREVIMFRLGASE